MLSSGLTCIVTALSSFSDSKKVMLKGCNDVCRIIVCVCVCLCPSIFQTDIVELFW